MRELRWRILNRPITEFAASFAGLGQIQSDLLIGVDGSRSLVRQKLISLPFRA